MIQLMKYKFNSDSIYYGNDIVILDFPYLKAYIHYILQQIKF